LRQQERVSRIDRVHTELNGGNGSRMKR
jgi:hypothetical protein